jgi:hypothetical protein
MNHPSHILQETRPGVSGRGGGCCAHTAAPKCVQQVLLRALSADHAPAAIAQYSSFTHNWSTHSLDHYDSIPHAGALYMYEMGSSTEPIPADNTHTGGRATTRPQAAAFFSLSRRTGRGGCCTGMLVGSRVKKGRREMLSSSNVFCYSSWNAPCPRVRGARAAQSSASKIHEMGRLMWLVCCRLLRGERAAGCQLAAAAHPPPPYIR